MRPESAAVENNFVKGLITEASGLNFPEHSCTETFNCIFDLVGRVSRRPGIDFEFASTTQTVNRSGSVIGSYLWRNVTGDGALYLVVQQIGAKLYFYNSTSVNSLSQGLEIGTIDLTGFMPASAPSPALNECQFADGFGKLYVVHPTLDSFYVTFDTSDNTFHTQVYSVYIRDFEGIPESPALTITERPSATVGTLSASHHYNLLNQGWNATVLAAWDTGRSDMPSNSDVWWHFKNSSDAFDVTTVANVDQGNTLAPKGSYILRLVDQDRATASGVAGATGITTGFQRHATITFYTGRLFYAGLNYQGLTSKIYFSQILERPDQAGLCYQISDPTSELTFDLLPADGGVISIPESGMIYKLFPMQTGLLVFATRGVWLITSKSGIGFTATDYSIIKVSNYRALSPHSFVEVNGLPIWWNTDGIFAITGSTNTNSATGIEVKPLSFGTIQTFFDNLPNTSKTYARGYFNPADHTVNWLYRSTQASTIEDSYEFDSVLVFNVLTGAFYPWTISDSAVKVHGLIVTDAIGGVQQEFTVIDDATDTVVTDAGETVTAYELQNTSVIPTFKYFVSYPSASSWKFTYAEARDPSYLDWATYDDGVDYTSYLITGYKIHGAAQRKFQPNYVFFYNQGVGQYYVQGIWDYANTGSGTGKFTSRQRLVYDDTKLDAGHKKVKMRGEGLALQYKIISVPGQPYTVTGWSAWETANPKP